MGINEMVDIPVRMTLSWPSNSQSDTDNKVARIMVTDETSGTRILSIDMDPQQFARLMSGTISADVQMASVASAEHFVRVACERRETVIDHEDFLGSNDLPYEVTPAMKRLRDSLDCDDDGDFPGSVDWVRRNRQWLLIHTTYEPPITTTENA